MDLPKETLNLLKCHLCDNYLSVFPIHSDEKGNIICGRCPINCPEKKREVAYETVAACVRFPCRYKKFGCTTAVIPIEMIDHETKCAYLPHNCFEDCGWQGLLNKMKDHYSVSHEDLLVNADTYFEISSINETHEFRNLLVHKENFFYFKMKKNNKGFSVGVYFISGTFDIQNYKFTLNLKLDSTNSVSLQPLNVESILLIADELFIEAIDLEKINFCKVTILCSLETNNARISSDTFLLKTFECTVCNTYITPPIEECPNGHITGVCKCKYNRLDLRCNLCNHSMQRSVALENIAAGLIYPCQYSRCNAMYLMKKKAEHEQKCKFVTFKCIIPNCTINITYEMIMNHFEEKHKDNMFINSLLMPLSNNVNKPNLIFHNGYIFIEKHWWHNKNINISVDLYSSDKTYLPFLFEVSIESTETQERIDIKTTKRIVLPVDMFTHNELYCLPSKWILKINIINKPISSKKDNSSIANQ